MNRILLINSPIFDFKINNDDENYLYPFGLGYIATNLIKNNIDVKIIDCVKDNLITRDIINVIEKEKPDFVGINIFSTNYHIIKRIVENTKAIFIIGGQTLKYIYEDIFKWKTNNRLYLVIGEGDYIVTDIVLNKVKELVSLINENIKIYNIDYKSLYFPKDLSKVFLNREKLNIVPINNFYNLKESSIITSRGCCYNCAFCGAARSLNKNTYIRELKYNDILDEIKYIKKISKDTECIRILDDLFLKNDKDIDKAIRLFSQVSLKWRSMAHVLTFTKTSYYNLLTLRNSGCIELFIGIESGSNRIREMINKKGSVNLVYEVIKRLLIAGINIKGYFIYGFPKENLFDFNSTYNLAKSLKNLSLKYPGNFRVSVFQFRPYIGTQLYYNILNENMKIENYTPNIGLNSLEQRKQFNFESGNFSNCSKEDINTFIINTMNLNNLK
ncbi:MAG: radical SAM protein [Clostridiales bacterium]